MNRSPRISIIGSGIRVNRWKDFYKNLSNNKLDFEIIFTGNVKPNFQLPVNFRFYYSETKPAQCVEISARHARGDLLTISSDDVIFSENYLDNLYDHYTKNCSDKDFVSGLFQGGGYFYSDEDYQFWPGVKGSPSMPMNLTLKRDLWQNLGGVDKNFIGLFYDLDIALRLMENGGKNFICKRCQSEEVFLNEGFYRRLSNFLKRKFTDFNPSASLFSEIGSQYDRPTLEKFWVKEKEKKTHSEEFYAIDNNKILLKKRAYPVESFENNFLTEFSQGPKNRWV